MAKALPLKELIRRFRVEARDHACPPMFEDVDVKVWLNEAQDQACIRGRLLREDALPAISVITLAANQRRYLLDPRVIEIISLRIEPIVGGCDRGRDLTIKSREWMDEYYPNWRAHERDADVAVQDETSLTITGRYEPGSTLRVECYRLPLQEMEAPTDEPEIHPASHPHLIYWALHKAFSLPDADYFDADKADKSEKSFTRYFGRLPDSDMRRSTREDLVQHNASYF